MIPYTTERRGDTGATNVTLGIWLFLASEVMLFGSMFSAYALLRVSSATWPSGADVLGPTIALVNTVVLAGCTGAAWRARRSQAARVRMWLLASALVGVVFLVLKGFEYSHEVAAGLLPATSTFLAAYFTLTGLHALHVIGGVAGNVWAAASATRVAAALTAGRVHALSLYWAFVDVVWLAILVLFYLT